MSRPIISAMNTLQTVLLLIGSSVFAPFAVLYLKEPFKLD